MVRPARREDLEAIGQVAYATAWLGDSLSGRFSDQKLFVGLFVRPYLEVGVAAFVAEEAGRILGYVLSARVLDLVRWFSLPPRIGWIPRLLGLPTPERKLLWGLLTAGAPHAPLRAYPAELHINLLPEARGKGLGKALLSTLLSALLEEGVVGVQLGTTRENHAALGLYRRFGFREYARRPSRFWTKALGRPVEAVRWVKRLGWYVRASSVGMRSVA